jgi:tRNA threonylcarbamoyladenosine biosynthesis protein TsaE
MGEARELELVSTSAAATRDLGRALGRLLPPGAVLRLDGELGAGKTALVQGLAEGLGVDDAIDSPTFTLMKEYEGRLPLYHYDAWMEGRERAFLEGGGEDLFHGRGVAVVEWGSRVADLLPVPHLWIRLAHRSETERSVVLALVEGGDEDAERASALWRAARDAARQKGLEPAAGGRRAP